MIKPTRKKGFLFTLDSFFAVLLLIGGILLLTQFIHSNPPNEQITYLSQDAMRALGTIKVKELNDSWVQNQIGNGNIDDPEESVLVQIGKYWAQNMNAEANNLSVIALGDALSDYDLDLAVEGTAFLNGTNTSRLVSSSRRMISGIAQGEALEGSTGVAFLQKITGKKSNAYAYFGGFTGQGNITARLDNLPNDLNSTNIQSIVLEGEFDGDFNLEINDAPCGGTYSASPSDLTILSYNLTSCSSLLAPGNNTVELLFDNVTSASVSGGFLRVSYLTGEFLEPVPEGTYIQYLPQIDGVINYYDGISIPGDLTNLTLYLHYEVYDSSARPLFFDIGNTTVYQSNETGEINVTLSSTYLSSLLDFSAMSDNTVPFRIGYYEGNNTNSTGNLTDVFLITSRAGPMDTADIIGTNETRMEVAKRLGHNFTDILLGQIGNRQGLVSYFASKSYDHALTTVAADLHTEITSYNVQNPTQSERALCQSMEEARDKIISQSSSDRNKAILLMTDGDTTKCCTGGQCTAEKARQDAIDVACDYYSTTGITYYTVGFGQEVTTDPAIGAMLEEIANCTDGQFAQSDNVTGLEDIYEQFANDIAQSSVVYTFQRITEYDNVASTLYADTRFEGVYTPTSQQPSTAQLAVTIQSEQFNSCTPTITIEDGLTVVSASMVSYSGDFWSKSVAVDGQVVYNLSSYGSDYALLGDPAQILIPAQTLNSGAHTFDIVLGANNSVDESCSLNNSLIYVGLINSTISRSNVLPEAEGCTWDLDFEDGTNKTVPIPSTYVGNKSCAYTLGNISYNTQDTYDVVVYRLLEQLDFDGDGEIFVNLDESDLEVVVTIVSQVPYMWGPSTARISLSK